MGNLILVFKEMRQKFNQVVRFLVNIYFLKNINTRDKMGVAGPILAKNARPLLKQCLEKLNSSKLLF